MFLVNDQLCLPPDDPTSSRKALKQQEDPTETNQRIEYRRAVEHSRHKS